MTVFGLVIDGNSIDRVDDGRASIVGLNEGMWMV